MKRIFITIYIALLIGFIGIVFGVDPIIQIFFQAESYEADRDLVKGTFYLIMEKLIKKDEEGQKNEIQILEPLFGYPLRLYKIDDVHLRKIKKRKLMNGEIVWKDNKQMVYQRIPGSDLVLAIGGAWPGGGLDLKFYTLGIIFLTGPAFFWTCFLKRDIRKIEKAAEKFYSGDHSVRVKIPRISSMTLIASVFNNMAEKFQHLLLSQKELANSVSHEIRTPLSRIKFSLQMLRDSVPSEFQNSNYISRISKDVEEIESLVDEMLTYAKFDREPENNFSLPKNEIIFWLKTIIYAEEKTFPDKTIHFKTLPVVDRFVTRFEPVYLGWAVRNIIRNACRYATRNVEITFEAGDEICAIHVDDDGEGIPADAQEKIFEPFFRIDESRNRNSGGYGLGLAIAKRIATWHKGSISVEKSPQKGARFTLYLPVNC